MMGHIGNMDEMPVWFYLPASMSVAEEGAKRVKLLKMGSKHS